MQIRNPQSEIQNQTSRRGFFGRMGDGLQSAALLYLLGQTQASAAPAKPRYFDLTPKQPHFEPPAKAVIQLFMQGGPSQVDLFDPKPMLDKHHGKSVFKELAADVSSPESAGGLLRSPFKFGQYGESGISVSNLLPHLQKQVDEITVVRSMFNTHPNHEPALFKIQSGQLLPGLPSLGSWVVYGLGSENQNLPAYIVLDDPQSRLPVNTVQNWQPGYLPPIYQGTRMRPTGSPVLNLKPEKQQPEEVVNLSRSLRARLDEIHKRQRPGRLELDARISSYELAARMQMSATDALDLTQETKETLDMYGVGEPKTDTYARRCLMARRLIERGVRFIQIYTRGQMWDNHSNIGGSLQAACDHTDKPSAALLKDLRQRGLLDDTLVVWGGEFGRLPIAQMRPGTDAKKAGRDHGPAGFSLWMAGGGMKRGFVYGATDEIGYKAVENRVSVNDWHATVLHAMGLNNEELHFERNGLKDRLTGIVDARVVKELFA
ncbi:MAG: DUF1501 domain-containing protein [Planctomycetaceae bacterium]|jgi:hypothetical protein|nr:DUF1501 domain-containing protein [Planctomycetaceae bacterium]MBT6487695.1 DUF1501 domain-containing protein [Planctomycetaceae bacterium]MBT6495647.1 DUF1501 domain-containing protein [Planctomycetaceae bacterium]